MALRTGACRVPAYLPGSALRVGVPYANRDHPTICGDKGTSSTMEIHLPRAEPTTVSVGDVIRRRLNK
jgi:hypothetical protein